MKLSDIMNDKMQCLFSEQHLKTEAIVAITDVAEFLLNVKFYD